MNKSDDIIKELEKNGFYIARMVSGSKSFYSHKYPNHVTFFNANLVDKDLGKIWYGDLDLTISGKILKDIAQKFNTIFYILYEMDGRFRKENDSIQELISRAKWDTTKDVPVYDKEWNIIPLSSVKTSNKQLITPKNVMNKKNMKKFFKEDPKKTDKLIDVMAEYTKLVLKKTNEIDNVLPKNIKNNKLDMSKIKNFLLAEQNEINEYAKEIKIVLEALGHPEALVTDLSMISDFIDFTLKNKNKKIEQISKKLGVVVKIKDYVWEVAKRIRNKK